MSISSSLCCQCKQLAGIKCLHCSGNFCRKHYNEHEELISVDINPLIDQLNRLIEEKLKQSNGENSQIKQKNIEDKFQLFQKQIQPWIENQENHMTNEQMKDFQEKLNEIELYMKKPLTSFSSSQMESNLFSLNNLKLPKRTFQIKFDSSPIATDGNYILLQDSTHSLGLYACYTLVLIRKLTWSTSNLSKIVDLHWSNYLKQFFILTREHLFILNNDSSAYNNTLTKMTDDDFRTMTIDDEHDGLFLATSKSIDEYSLSTFKFSKQYFVNDQHIYSLRYNLNINQFGLTVRTCHDHKWFFEVRNRSMIRLWSILTPIQGGLCWITVLLSSNEWIVVNIRGDILFQINNDGHMKAEVIYGGKELLNAIEINKKVLAIRTYEFLEQYVL